MADKKNIVIKVKYPTAGKISADATPEGKTITVWDVKRISIAVVVLLTIIGLMIYFSSGNEEGKTTQTVEQSTVTTNTEAATDTQTAPETKTSPAEQALVNTHASETTEAEKPVITAIKEPAIIVTEKKTVKQPTESATKTKPIIIRSILTNSIKHREPTHEVTQVKVTHTKSQKVYFFNELKGMKGSKLYHEWLFNGKVVDNQQLFIGENQWRTSTHRLFSDKSQGQWTVRLINEKHQVLNEKSFNVKLE